MAARNFELSASVSGRRLGAPSNGNGMKKVKAVVLAGGRGTRLAPYTSVLPKPLMPVGERAILEIVVDQLEEAGVVDIRFCVGYLSHLIQAVFDNRSNGHVNISYIREKNALGTAAPLLLMDDLDSTFIVMNGDVLTTLDYAELVRHHRAQGNALTIATHTRSIKLDYGLLNLDVATRVREYEEKPEIPATVSMGIYVMEPEVLEHIPKRTYFDFPDLVQTLLAEGYPVGAYRHGGTWFDIGRHEDYAEAVEAWEQHSEERERELVSALTDRAGQNGAKLNGAKRNGARHNGAKLNGAKLNGAKRNGAKLNGAKLNGAKQNGAKQNGAKLNGAKLNGAKLNGAKHNGAKLNGAKHNGAKLNGAKQNGAAPAAGGKGVSFEVFTETFSRVPAAVSVVTTYAENGRPHGTTVSAFCSLSVNPPLVLVALDRGSDLLSLLKETRRFGLNVLAAEQEEIGRACARKGADKFADVSWHDDSQLPRIDGAAAWLACEVEDLLPGGDHLIVVGLATSSETEEDAEPLVYHRRRFLRLD